MKIAIVLANAYGMGGTIRTVFNLASSLAEKHDVEIVSVGKYQEEPFFAVPDGVTLRPLSSYGNPPSQSGTTWLGRWRQRRYGGIVPPTEEEKKPMLDADRAHAFRSYLRSTDADVVMGTRPGINIMLARWAPSRLLTIGQEHVHLEKHIGDVRAAIGEYYPQLDGISVLTETDRESYLEFFAGDPSWVRTIPNLLPSGAYPRSHHDNPIIVAAGRITAVKQYPRLVEAFAAVAQRYPEWRLRIYGGGKGNDKDTKIQQKIAKLGLSNQVTLMDRTTDLTGELAKASMLAVSSRFEGFGMTIIEGFSVGIPAVSFDCPHGPREIIQHEHNGLLVRHQDVAALSDGLLHMVENPAERRRMGEEALRSSETYSSAHVASRWEDFFAQRLSEKRGRRVQAA